MQVLGRVTTGRVTIGRVTTGRVTIGRVANAVIGALAGLIGEK